MASEPPTLAALLASTKHLLQQFSANLLTTPSETLSTQTSSGSPDPLAVLKDSATLLKAHTTKLGLLLLNKPFTPSAVTKVLLEVSRTCIPAMMSAVEILGTTYGVTVEAEVRGSVRQTFIAVQELCKDIEAVSTSPDKQDLKKQSDSTLASTGQVWSACDNMLELVKLGPAGIVCKKAEEHRQLLRDAIEELKEFSTEEDEGYDDDDVSDQDSDVRFGPSKVPSSRPELRAQVQSSAKKLGLLDVAVKAVTKRRLKSFPFSLTASNAKAIKQLDTVMGCLKELPDEVDELAGRFYELNETGATAQLDVCVATLSKAVTLVKDGWLGDPPDASEEKPFTEWVDKWKAALQQ